MNKVNRDNLLYFADMAGFKIVTNNITSDRAVVLPEDTLDVLGMLENFANIMSHSIEKDTIVAARRACLRISKKDGDLASKCSEEIAKLSQ